MRPPVRITVGTATSGGVLTDRVVLWYNEPPRKTGVTVSQRFRTPSSRKAVEVRVLCLPPWIVSQEVYGSRLESERSKGP